MPVQPKKDLDEPTQKLDAITIAPEEAWKLVLQKLQDLHRSLNENKVETDGRFDDIVTRLKIVQQTPAATGQKGPICRRGCGAELKWPAPYVKGAPPVNKDGTPHFCQGKPQA